MTVSFFVLSAGSLIFAWLATTYFWTVPMESYRAPSAPVVASEEKPEVFVTSGQESLHALTTENTGRH